MEQSDDPIRTPHFLSADDINGLTETVHVHQFNDNTVRNTRSIGDVLGMNHLGIHLVRLEQGHDSTQYHLHHHDEEFVYIVEGRGIAQIGADEFPVGPGDFMGFTAPSEAHNLFNPHTDDLVYLMGGERNNIDICDYPRLKGRMFRVDGIEQFVDLENLHEVKPKA